MRVSRSAKTMKSVNYTEMALNSKEVQNLRPNDEEHASI